MLCGAHRTEIPQSHKLHYIEAHLINCRHNNNTLKEDLHFVRHVGAT